MKAILLAIAAIVAATQCQAADISKAEDFYIYITGEIVKGDAAKLGKLLSDERHPYMFILNSNGGVFSEGLTIAETVLATKSPTVVHSGSVCASVCGLIWLAGVFRSADVNAHIGFHAIYDMRDGHEIGVGNAMVGAFLTKLGYPLETVAYVTSAPPDSMMWLTQKDAVQYGISFTAQDATKKNYFVDVCPKNPGNMLDGNMPLLLPIGCYK